MGCGPVTRKSWRSWWKAGPCRPRALCQALHQDQQYSLDSPTSAHVWHLPAEREHGKRRKRSEKGYSSRAICLKASKEPIQLLIQWDVHSDGVAGAAWCSWWAVVFLATPCRGLLSSRWATMFFLYSPFASLMPLLESALAVLYRRLSPDLKVVLHLLGSPKTLPVKERKVWIRFLVATLSVQYLMWENTTSVCFFKFSFSSTPQRVSSKQSWSWARALSGRVLMNFVQGLADLIRGV